MKTPDEAIQWLIDIVQIALGQGHASTSEIEAWLLAAISLEDLTLERAAETQEIRSFSAWADGAAKLH